MKFAASVDPQGQIRIYENQRWTDWLSKRKGQRVEIEVRDEAAIRSNRQNRYWWGVIVPFFVDEWTRRMGLKLPLNKDATHDVLVKTFDSGGRWETPLGPGRRSSSTMTVAEFTALIDTVREYARETYGAQIPTPEEWSEHA